MTQEEIIMRHRLNLLLRSRSIKNISAACRQEGVLRTVYYKYRKRYLFAVFQGLKDKEKSSPIMPNATKKKTIEKVIDIAKKYPSYGPLRLANELGNAVCSATVYNILKKHGLAKKLDRLLALSEMPSSLKLSTILLRKHPRPGYLLSVDTFYACMLKGVGRIYQFSSY